MVMMAKKQNPILAAFEAKKEAEFKQRLARNTEINMMAMLLAGSDLGFLGEKRAGALLDSQIEMKMKLARDLVADSESDPTLTYTKADLFRSLHQILGPAEWVRCQKLFPLLHDYWVEGGPPDGEDGSEKL